MKIISFINERLVIKKIQDHLKLWEKQQWKRPPPRAGPSPPVKPGQERYQTSILTMPNASSDDGWPGYEEPYITYN